MAGEAAESGLRFFLDRGLGAPLMSFRGPCGRQAGCWRPWTSGTVRTSRRTSRTHGGSKRRPSRVTFSCARTWPSPKPLGSSSRLYDQRSGVRPIQCINHRPDDGAVVHGQRSEDNQGGIGGGRTVRHGGESGLRPAQGQACLSAGLILPAPTRPSRRQQLVARAPEPPVCPDSG